MKIEVETIGTAKSFIDSLVSINKGYYEKDIFNNSNRFQQYELKIRLPSENFETLLNALEFENGEILHKRIKAKDVTEEYLDLDLSDVEFEPWTGWRPMSSRGFPIISKTKKCKNLTLAVGHGMVGLSTAAGTGYLVNELISNKADQQDLDLYRL